LIHQSPTPGGVRAWEQGVELVFFMNPVLNPFALLTLGDNSRQFEAVKGARAHEGFWAREALSEKFVRSGF